MLPSQTFWAAILSPSHCCGMPLPAAGNSHEKARKLPESRTSARLPSTSQFYERWKGGLDGMIARRHIPGAMAQTGKTRLQRVS